MKTVKKQTRKLERFRALNSKRRSSTEHDWYDVHEKKNSKENMLKIQTNHHKHISCWKSRFDFNGDCIFAPFLIYASDTLEISALYLQTELEIMWNVGAFTILRVRNLIVIPCITEGGSYKE